MKILTWLLKPSTKIINKILSFDQETFAYLKHHTNKCVYCKLTDINFTCYFIFSEQGITLAPHYEGTPTASISGKSRDLLDMLRAQSNNKHEIMISGDIEFVQELKALFAKLDIDWEEQLAQISGDVIAHAAFVKLRKIHEWIKQSHVNIQRNITEYLQEEARHLVTSIELEDFYDNIACLRNDLERTHLRVMRLLQQQGHQG